MRKWIVAIGIALLLLVVALYAIAPALGRAVRGRTQAYLSGRFESDVQFSDFQVSLFPKVQVTLSDLVLRHDGRTDIPPLIQARKVTLSAGLLGLLRHPAHLESVRLEGLQVSLPPRKHDGKPAVPRSEGDLAKKYPLVINEITADDAVVAMLRAEPGRAPKEFPIHHMEFNQMSFDRPATFHAELTNPLPKGEIDSTGSFGPWDAEEPSSTPVDAKYTFRNADLGTLKGISGILSSQGKFSGPLDYLQVEGEADVPDFALRMSDHPMALHTDFSAVVDGTNGDTYLNSVTAKFLNTSLSVKGKVVDYDPEIKGRTIVLNAVSRNARIEDLLLLGVKSNPPLMTGAAQLKTSIDIPEGNEDLLERLKLKGQVGVGDAEFTSPGVRKKIEGLSRRAQGKPKDMEAGMGASELQGSFQMDKELVTLSGMHFSLEGASIELDGTYNLESSEMNFHGELRMEAKLSQTTTGKKSFFLKAIDPFFEGKHTGTVVRIKITGTKDNPSIGPDFHDPENKN
jgi:hypothetical protein